MHVVSAIYHMSDFPERYVDKCFHVDTYIKTYRFHVSPMVGQQSWKPTGFAPIKAPRLDVIEAKKRERRTTKRKKGQEETNQRQSTEDRVSKKDTIIHCSNCTQPGHNKAKCHERLSSVLQTETEIAAQATAILSVFDFIKSNIYHHIL
ncbi:hypothetical protein LINGRAHAP2_LOCUS5249 [Linum grandiflorum]